MREIRLPAIRLRETVQGYLFIAPWFLGFLLLTAGPMLISLYISGTSWTMLSPPVWVGTENYTRVLGTDDLFTTSLLNTLFYVALAVPLGILVALLLALLLHQSHRGQSFFRTVFFLPSIAN